jgi:hypothetical protein
MRFAIIAVTTATALTALSCSTTSIQTDRDDQADFGSYSTFGWYTADDRDPQPKAGASQIVDGRIRRALAENLIAKGYTQTTPAAADLQVAYYTSLSSQLRVYGTGWGYGWGYGPSWGFGYACWPGWTMSSVSTYIEGTIIVDVIDRGKNQLVWRGVATNVLSKKSSSEEKINQTMTRVLSTFPAK